MVNKTELHCFHTILFPCLMYCFLLREDAGAPVWHSRLSALSLGGLVRLHKNDLFW